MVLLFVGVRCGERAMLPYPLFCVLWLLTGSERKEDAQHLHYLVKILAVFRNLAYLFLTVLS